MRPLSGGTFRFDPGASCFEFAYTGGDQGLRAVYETLHTPADLAHWLAGHLGSPSPEVSDDDFAGAISLRGAVWACADAVIAGVALPAAAVAEVNRHAARPPLAPQIVGTGAAGRAEPFTTAQVLATLARDAVALFTGPHAHRIRMCAADDCELVFVDTSRPGRRRWCSMERCGNRVKVNRFRHRTREEQ